MNHPGRSGLWPWKLPALNHPNICTLHDVGPNFLVMEYVEGKVLKGPLPLDQALRYAAQICDALAAAHSKKITHRDLKPANILVTRQGVKLLDFGLAKFGDPVEVAQENLTTGLTSKGQILGTLLYMSPEQINGQEAGPQSDIFSFGLVLHEMLTGKRAFDGSTPASVMVAILERPAPSVSHVAPPALDRVLRRCLEKDQENRWQSVRDLRAALELVSADPGSDHPGSKRQAVGPHNWRERVAWLALMFVLLGFVVFLVLRPAGTSTPGELIRFPVYPPDKLLLPGPVNTTVGVPQTALSPNGKNLAFVAAPPGARPMIWVRPLDQVTARPLAGTEDGEYPFWSFDSSWVGYFAHGQLLKVRPGGGPVQVMANDIPDPRGGSWNSDGTILAGSGAGALLRISEGGGITVPATKLDAAAKERSHRWPHFLPDGRHFLYLVRSADADIQGVYVGSLDGDKKQLIHSVDSPAIYASGFLLFTDGSTLMGQAFDAHHREFGAQPFPVAEHVGHASNSYGAFSVSNAGILTYSGANSEVGQLTWLVRPERQGAR